MTGVDFSREEFEGLKEQFINQITENRTTSDEDRCRKNVSRLWLEIEEREEKRLVGLKQLDRDADEFTKQTILRKINLEKQALAEALDEILVGGKLPPIALAKYGFAKATGISQKNRKVLTIIKDRIKEYLILAVVTGIIVYSLSFIYGTDILFDGRGLLVWVIGLAIACSIYEHVSDIWNNSRRR